MEKYSLLQNILLGLTLAAPIGPVNLEIIKRGLISGFKQAFLTGTGAMSADATYLTLIFFGLTTFLNIAFMKIFLGITGSIILIYLGTLSVKDYFRKISTTEKRVFIPNTNLESKVYRGGEEETTQHSTGKHPAYNTIRRGTDDEANKGRRMNANWYQRSFITGYVLAISSPMTIVWWTGVFGALLASQTNTVTNISAFFSCLSILLGCFLWVFSLAAALHFGKKFISEAPCGKPQGILNSKEGDCIPLTPAPHSSPPLMAGYSAEVS